MAEGRVRTIGSVDGVAGRGEMHHREVGDIRHNKMGSLGVNKGWDIEREGGRIGRRKVRRCN